MFLFKKPVVQLPKLTTSSGADLAAKANLHPDSQSLLKPGMSSSEYIHALDENKQSADAVKALSHGMPERDSVWWACKSSDKVADKLNPEEKAASAAAEAWVKNPSAASKAAAGEAAAKTDFTGPGGWAAQAAAWSKDASVPGAQSAAPGVAGNAVGSAAGPAAGSAAGAGITAASAPSAPALTAAAVSGAVLLAAGLAGRPPMAAPQKPALTTAPNSAPKADLPKESTAPQQPEAPAVNQTKMAKMLQPFIDLGKDVASGKNSWA